MTLDSNTETAIEQILGIASQAVYGSTSTTTAETRFRMEVERFLKETLDIDAALGILIEVGEKLGLVTRDSHGQFRPRKNAASAGASSAAPTDDAQGHMTSASQEAISILPDVSSDLSAEGQSPIADEGSPAIPVVPDAGGAAGSPASAHPTNGNGNGHSNGNGQSAADIAARNQAATMATIQATLENEPDGDYWSTATKAKAEIYEKAFEFKMGDGRPIGDYRYSELNNAELKSDRDGMIFREIRKHGVPVGDPKVKKYMKAKAVFTIIRRADERRKSKEIRRAAH